MTGNTTTYIDSTGQQRTDRRLHHRVREVFDRAWAVMEPMLSVTDGKSVGKVSV